MRGKDGMAEWRRENDPCKVLCGRMTVLTLCWESFTDLVGEGWNGEI